MDPQLRNDIQQVLVQIGTSSPAFINSAVSPKLYEIYVLSLVARALRLIGARITAHDSSDRPTSNLQFRLNPGRIYSPTTSPGFLLVEYEGSEYELHNGLRVEGSSKVLHELDICLIDRGRAISCRNNRKDPTARDVHCLLECKFYGGDLPLGLGREFVGLSKEVSVRIRCLASNESNNSIRKLLRRHQGFENFTLSPQNQSYVDQRFVPWMAEHLRQIL
ncbi:hypothetical protein [Planctomicrobium piriforme]|uniref:Uncharacterized protein n=1 Tax=Planctomicrobium piriforme TaxID=1576369 RepID=A0A1I3BH11_9PLAN|nr:hypothetical protein [Planctomicrobium piriforme]SFH61573.1 hypothetical protein SAMN05421753_101450 [Planctomicrobium piriforme]